MRVVLGIFTLFSLAMLFSAQMAEWDLVYKELIIAAVVAAWVVHIKKIRGYEFRAKFIALMSWLNFFIYAMHSYSFTSMIATMSALIVLMGIFCIPQVVYVGMVFSNLIFVYHLFISQTYFITNANDVMRLVLHILAMYSVSLVTWMMIRTQQQTRQQLIENIHELEITEKSKDDFMVNISHEIRTPINAVCGMSEAILQGNLPTDVRRDVIDIQTAGRNLLSTVSNILDFSELVSGDLELAEESYNITSTITDIINMALTYENGRNLELIVDCDADLPSNLLGDEQKIRRIVLNLLENAIKFTREGGVILRIKRRKEEYGINLVVTIKDSGIGMDKKDLEKVFTSFGQINAGRDREEGGVGLGIAISKALVQSMGGFITVKSTPGVGSEFQFTIPQKVLDETPIVSIRNKQQLYAVCYINMEKYNYSIIREGYESSIRHIVEQFGVIFKISKNLAELKRRMEHENYTHIFISWDEYCEDRNFFEELAKETTVVLILDYGQETRVGSNMLRIYKPFTVLSIASVFNGHKVVQRDEQHFDTRHRFVAPNANVLVVDDNAMNLKVMSRLLLPYQIKVTTADSGQEALNKLDSMPFDCVFLDHMMPEMDGVETLHKIRQKPGTYFQSLSIIAFTANAIGGAREMFLGEGFNDFIAKPIELSVLERMLRRYIPKQKQIIVEDGELDPVREATAPAMEISSNGSSFEGGSSKEDVSLGNADSPAGENIVSSGMENMGSQSAELEARALDELGQIGINVQQGLTYCGDEEGFRDILSIYHTEGAKRQKQIEQFYKDQDWKNYVITVHALKSNSKGVGANELAELALNLEMAGKENRIDYIFENNEELLEKHEALLRALDSSLFLYPDGNSDADSEAGGKLADSVGEEGEIRTAQDSGTDAGTGEMPGDSEIPSLEEQVATLKEKLESFESEGVDKILDFMAKEQYDGTSLAELAEQIRDKVNEFDFLDAFEILKAWEEENFV